MSAAARILLVEDELNMVRTLVKILERRGYEVVTATNGVEALKRFDDGEFDVLLTDLNMPVMDGMQLLRELRQRQIAPATLVLTGHGTIQSAVEAMKLGASDYMIKPCHPEELLLKVTQALELRRLRREVTTLRQELRNYHRYGEIIGKSPAMQRIYAVIDAVSQNKSNILIWGENGTGKELVARAIHDKGPLAGKPFVAINCGALAETLLESQLFGHRKGAFTGAIEDHQGVFQTADGGTLFLDEVSSVPVPLQVKFLRAIQEREVTPLGSSRPIKFDVRLIAATNTNLEEGVKLGTFRADLYYRLNVVPIYMAPLRERPEDIPLLVEHFIEEFSHSYGVEPKRVTPEAMELLTAYAWPGNIRELQNAIERAFAISPAREIGRDSLPAPIIDTSARASATPSMPVTQAVERAPSDNGSSPPATNPFTEPMSLAEAERFNIAAALRKSAGNKNEAARILGIDRQRLYRKIAKYGLE